MTITFIPPSDSGFVISEDGFYVLGRGEYLTATDIALEITNGSASTVMIEGSIISEQGTAIAAGDDLSTAEILISDGATVFGSAGGIDVGDFYGVTNNGTVVVEDGDGIAVQFASLTNNGTVSQLSSNIQWPAENAGLTTEGGRIFNHGIVEGFGTGLFLNSQLFGFALNTGTINADVFGVHVQGAGNIDNSGEIYGFEAGILIEDVGGSVINSGAIIGGLYGISAENASLELKNTGTIQSEGLALHSSPEATVTVTGGDALITNSGTILNGLLGGAIRIDGGDFKIVNTGTIGRTQDGDFSDTAVTTAIFTSGSGALTNDGQIYGGVELGLGTVAGDGAQVEFVNSGSVTSYIVEPTRLEDDDLTAAVQMQADEVTFVNSGDINVVIEFLDILFADDTAAVRLEGDEVTFVNSGDINLVVEFGDALFFDTQASALSIVADEALEFQNTGVISIVDTSDLSDFEDIYPGWDFETPEPIAIELTGASDAVVTNTGTIIGDVRMAEGSDLFDTRDGVLIGDLYTGAGNDTAYANDSGVTFFGEGGRDRLYGGDGDDTLSGGSGNDRLYAGRGENVLNGNNGADQLFAQRGDNTLTGGNGADKFIFGRFAGDNVVTDFTAGTDMIDLARLRTDFASVTAAAEDTADGVLIDLGDLGGSGVVLLEDVLLADLDADDFLF